MSAVLRILTGAVLMMGGVYLSSSRIMPMAPEHLTSGGKVVFAALILVLSAAAIFAGVRAMIGGMLTMAWRQGHKAGRLSVYDEVPKHGRATVTCMSDGTVIVEARQWPA